MMGTLTFLFYCFDFFPVLNLLLEHAVVSLSLPDGDVPDPFLDFFALAFNPLFQLEPHLGESGL